VQAASLPLVWLTARTCIACVEPHAKDTPSKRLVVPGGIPLSDGHVYQFHGQGAVEGVVEVLGAEMRTLSPIYERGRGGRLHGRG
jgi:hypothetical protein